MDRRQEEMMPSYNPSPSCQISGYATILESVFGYKPDGVFVDAGAYDGLTYSNTSCLVEAGWSGIMIEPHPDAYRECAKRHSRQVIMYQHCVGDHEGDVLLYPGGALSTTCLEIAEAYQNMSWAAGIVDKNKPIMSRMFTLDTLLRHIYMYQRIDLVSIDTEGSEYDVLKGFDIKFWRPRMVIVEACEHHEEKILAARAPEINSYFDVAGYKKIYCDKINSIYVENP
jgi:FkbM family methyltransferase